jgi:hypothetical protein
MFGFCESGLYSVEPDVDVEVPLLEPSGRCPSACDSSSWTISSVSLDLQCDASIACVH